MYAVGESPGDTFIKNPTVVLHSLANVSRELEEVAFQQSNAAIGGLPPTFTHTMLSCYHVNTAACLIQVMALIFQQCIVLATRPLVMWLLMLYLPSMTTFPPQMASPTFALLQKSTESAMTIIRMLDALAKHDLLGKPRQNVVMCSRNQRLSMADSGF